MSDKKAGIVATWKIMLLGNVEHNQLTIKLGYRLSSNWQKLTSKMWFYTKQ
jgi:hypothetical protein